MRKIRAPFQPELALDAVVDGARPELVFNDEVARLLNADCEAIHVAAGRTS